MGSSSQSLDLVPSPLPLYERPAPATLRDVAAVLFRRQKIILLLFFTILSGATLCLTWLAPYLNPPRFVSGLRFIIKKERFDAVVTPADRSVPGLTTTVSPQEVYSEIELLKSADVLERLAEETPAGSPARALERLRRDLVAEPVLAGRNVTNLIAVRYSASDPNEVIRVLQRLPELYLAKHLSVNQRPGALEYYRSQAETFEQQLQQAEKDLAAYEKRRTPWDDEAYRQQARQKLSEVEKQKWEAEAAIREADSKGMELSRQFSALPALIAVARLVEESSYLQRLNTQLLELENQRAQASFHREIEQLNARIGEIRQAIVSEGQKAASRGESSQPNPARAAAQSELLRNQALLAGLRARRGSLIQQEGALRQQWSAAEARAAENAVRMAELARQRKAAEENFLVYRKKYAEAREADTLDRKRVVNVSLAEGPRLPVPLERRNLWFYLAVSFVFALAGATAGGLTAEVLDHSIHTPRQLEQCSSLAVLACLPDRRPT